MAGRTYRYDQQNVQWAFGHGRSYSSFAYSGMSLSTKTIQASSCETVNISFTLKNTGAVAAEEVTQAYVRWTTIGPIPPSGGNGGGADVQTPALSLLDFARVKLAAGASVVVTLAMAPRQMAVLTDARCGVVPPQTATQLQGTPFATVAAAASEDCCHKCSVLERCEAFTYVGGHCQLFTHWGLTNHSSAGAVSGEPLAQWVLRGGTVMEVSVGGASDKRTVVGSVTVGGGGETALTSCPQPLPNSY